MFQRKPRRFRHRVNGRNNMSHNNSQHRIRTNQFSNGQPRNSFRPSLSAEKSFENELGLNLICELLRDMLFLPFVRRPNLLVLR